MPQFKENTNTFRMKSSPAKLLGLSGKTRRMKLARKYQLEDRETRKQEQHARALTGHGPFSMKGSAFYGKKKILKYRERP
jgi:hypothetical protein